MLNKNSLNARFSATGAQIARNEEERQAIKAEHKASVSKAIQQNVKDQLNYQNKSAEEVIERLITVEGLDRDTATKLVTRIQKTLHKIVLERLGK